MVMQLHGQGEADRAASDHDDGQLRPMARNRTGSGGGHGDSAQ